MKVFELNGTLRSEYGKKAAKGLRKQELIPCNLYGLGENITFAVEKEAVRKLVYTPDTMAVALTIGEKKMMAVVKELQFHPLTDNLLHIDFLAVDEKKAVVVEIPVQLTGHAEGVKAGGKLVLNQRKLKVKAPYTSLPDTLEIDVTSLGLGKSMKVSALSFEGLEIITSKEVVVCAVRMTRAARSAAETATEESAE